MDHVTVSIFLYNMDTLCDSRVELYDIKTTLCDMGVL